MARPKRRLRKGALVVVGVVAVLMLATRLLRHQATAPVRVGASVLRVRNLFTEIYGARVGDRVVLFDAGVDEAGDALDVLLAGLGANRDGVSDVFLSHGHFDHVAASPLCTKARIHVGAEDVALLAQAREAVGEQRPAARLFSLLFAVPPIHATDPYPGRVTLPISDGRNVLAIPLPGHTRGSYVMVFDGVLFAGDSLQIDGDRLELAMGAFSVDMEANRRGVVALRNALAGAAIDFVCTGHQGCTPPGRARAMLDELTARAGAAGR
jgi:glyoxylase-like metal-dependent hydrolase (beta-lactamase superfamily II)